MHSGDRRTRYQDAASRELIGGAVRQPQWDQAMREAGGDLEVAVQFYQMIRAREIEQGESEHESALDRIKRLRTLNDYLTPLSAGRFLLLLLVASIVTIAFWYWLQTTLHHSHPLR